MSGTGRYVAVVAAVLFVLVHVVPGWRLPLLLLFLLLLSLSLLLLLLLDHLGCGVTRVRFAVRDQKAGSALSHLALQRSFQAV